MYIKYIEYVSIYILNIFYRLIRCVLRVAAGKAAAPRELGRADGWPPHRSQPTIVFPARQQAQPAAPGPGLGRASCGEFTIWLQH